VIDIAEKIGSVMVVGGGISGMQSSLDLADSGFKVFLVDKKPAIGGVMAQLDKTFPTNDCSMCIMAPKLVATGRHRNIELISNAEIEKVEGEEGNFTVTVRKRTRRVIEESCTGCGECAKHCPVEVPDRYNQDLRPSKAIAVHYAQAIPLVYSIDAEACIGCGMCDAVCGAGAIDYSGGEYDPSSNADFGYGTAKNVVTSIDFERMLSSTGPSGGIVLRSSDGDIPKKVAFIQCVGSRNERDNAGYCSSVCCMYAIKEAVIAKEHCKGMEPHIFFMDKRAFGKEFEYYLRRGEEEHGLLYHKGRIATIVEDPQTHDLTIRYVEDGRPQEEVFQMVVLSVGLRPPLDVEKLALRFGVDLNDYGFCATSETSPLNTSRPGIYVSGAFSGPKDIPETVAQASGAASKAATSIADVRGTLETKVEYPKEVMVEGLEPRIGVFVCHCGINIASVVDVPDVVEYAKTLPNVVFVENNLYTCSQDTQEHMNEVIKEQHLNRVVVASCSPRTHEPLFRNTCKEAGLNPYLFEQANIRDQDSWIHMHEPEIATAKAKDLVRMAVAKSRLLEALTQSTIPVTQVGLVIGGGVAGMTAAVDLAKQGYEVHLVEKEQELGGNLNTLRFMAGIDDPKKLCQDMIDEVKAQKLAHIHTGTSIEAIDGSVGNFRSTLVKNGTKEEIDHGIVIVATGAQEYEPTEYLHGKNPKVMTHIEFEQMLEKGDVPNSVVFIQCVGSRSSKKGERGYCSRICCTHTMRQITEIKARRPDANMYVLYRDIRTYGFKEKYYREARDAGAFFISFEEDSPPLVEEEGDSLKVTVFDKLIGRKVRLEPDVIVLASAVIPREDNEVIAKMLKLPLSRDQFFLEAHMKLRPVDFAVDGVFLAGLAHSPKFIDEVISQASAAVSRACTILSKERMEAEGIISTVNEDVCNGCGLCVPVCEYGAISLEKVAGDPGKLLAQINEALCKGCGSCSSACPSSAMEQKGFKSNQLDAMIDECLATMG